jgi:DNA segregation ATPase FtsK/SpoIIIE, S-DNA-T family
LSTVIVRRRPRRPAPSIPEGVVEVPAPPEIPAVPTSRWGQLLTLLPLLTGTVATALLFARQDGGVYSYVVGGVFGVSSLGMLATNFGSSSGQPRKAEMMAARRDYLRHLAALRTRVRATADQQRTALHYRHPDPASLWSAVDSHRLWERRPTDGDFGVVRVGLGAQSLATELIAPVSRPTEELEPSTARALRNFLDAHALVPDLPVAISVRDLARCYVRGPLQPTRALVRALLAQLTVFHAPGELVVAVVVAADRRPDWDYLKWLPHALHPDKVDALGPRRLVASTGVELEQLLGELVTNRPRFAPGGEAVGPHLVVVLDGADLSGAQHLGAEGGLQGVVLIDLDNAPPRLLDRATLALSVDAAGTLRGASAEDASEVGTADQLPLTAAQALARQLAPLRLAVAGSTVDAPLAGVLDLADLLGIGDPDRFDVAHGWAPRPNRDRLRVPIGVGSDGYPVELDLKESAQDGMGPHGLLIGATGSGKSELLRTLVLGLAASHDSEALNFVLVDFKGGATFASFDRLPHTAAVITNLHDELPLVDRMSDALNGELVRRQELLRRAGNLASLRDYERARAGGAALAALPVLLVVCDEFSELLSEKPEFIDNFVQIGRLGRSLGVHLLLASQRLEEGRLRGLDTHLSYRIGLRTFSPMESRTVLGVADAYELPRTPGHGYLKFGTEPLTRFKAAYVSGPYRRPTPEGHGSAAGGVLHYDTYELALPQTPASAAPVPEPAQDAPSLLDRMVGRLAGAGAPAHQVWLPPLASPPALDELLGAVVTEPGTGLTVASPQLRGALRAPIALLDKPFEQRREPLWLALDGAAGHVAIVGAPRTGRSTLLRTLITGLALTHTPAQAQFYCLDFGGGGLGGLRELPHVGVVASRLDAATVRRTVGDVYALLTSREKRFAGSGVDSIAGYRRQGYPGDAYGEVFLVIDGWATIRGEYDDLEPLVLDIATRGLSYGVHVLAAGTRWLDFRPAVRDLFGTKLELRLGEPADSLVNRKAAGNVPEHTPGRGLTTEGLHFLAAQPQLAGAEPAELVKAIAAGWAGPPAPPVRLLPTDLPYADLVTAAASSGLTLPLGVAEADLGPVSADFATDPHLLVFGDSGSGKSSLLRSLATSIARQCTPEQARIILVDHRRSLLGAVQSDHLIGYGATAAETRELIDSVVGYMQRRLPGPEITPAQLRDRSWWTGPECFVLVDDYDLVAAGATNPVAGLLDFLAQARDVGLHLVLARRAGGAGRALYEPVIQRLREITTPGLLLSGEREEGALLGDVRAHPLPPGRAILVNRRTGTQLVQLGHLPVG